MTAQPIDSAPRDGLRIFVSDGHGECAPAFWHEGTDGAAGMFTWHAEAGAVGPVHFEPSHWAHDYEDFHE